MTEVDFGLFLWFRLLYQEYLKKIYVIRNGKQLAQIIVRGTVNVKKKIIIQDNYYYQYISMLERELAVSAIPGKKSLKD